MDAFNPVPGFALDWMEGTWLNHFMLDFAWTWVSVETLHFAGMCLLFGSIVIMDLRLVGIGRQALPVSSHQVLVPLALSGFVINLVTGIMFLFGNPYRYAMNISFQIKMVLVLLAGLNALYLWRTASHELESLGEFEKSPTRLMLVGASSLLLWLGVIVFGRMMPYLGTG